MAVDKEKLRGVVDNLIDNDKDGSEEQARVAFHTYLNGKMQDVLGIDVANSQSEQSDDAN